MATRSDYTADQMQATKMARVGSDYAQTKKDKQAASKDLNYEMARQDRALANRNTAGAGIGTGFVELPAPNSRAQYNAEKEAGGPMTDLSFEEWKKL